MFTQILFHPKKSAVISCSWLKIQQLLHFNSYFFESFTQSIVYPKLKKNKILIIIQKNLIATAWHFSTIHITGQQLQGGKTCSQNTWIQAWHLRAVAFSKSAKAWRQLKFSVFILNNRCGFHGLHQHSGVEQLRVKRPSKVFRVHYEWLASVKNANAIAEADNFLPMGTWILW